MMKLLIKLFIKDYKNTDDQDVRGKYGVLAGTMGIVLNMLLFAGKYLSGILSGSIAITADAFNNLSDAGSSIVMLAGFKLAAKKPDPDHPFGHGRIEYITGFIVSMLILLMGFEIAKSSVEKIFNPQNTQISLISITILAVSILIKLYMAIYNKSISKKINSAAMAATASDSLSDCIATVVVLLSMIVFWLTNLNIDGYCGILVSIFIFRAGITAAKETISPLLGQPPEPEFVKNIEDIVMAHKEIIGIHDLIVHDYGPGRVMISLHGEVSGDGNIYKLHDAIDNIENELKEKLNCLAVIHIDPVDINNKKVNEYKGKVKDIINKLDGNLSMHDFRMVSGPTHTNVIFDIVVPFDYKLSDNEIKSKISELILEFDPTCFAVITVDKSYVK